MKKIIIENGIRYKLGANDIYYPELEVKESQPSYGKYGMLRKSFLKEHKKGLYSSYLLTGKLTDHLNQVDREANERFDLLVKQMTEKRNINECLKAQNQIRWIQEMNTIQKIAEECVLHDFIYTF